MKQISPWRFKGSCPIRIQRKRAVFFFISFESSPVRYSIKPTAWQQHDLSLRLRKGKRPYLGDLPPSSRCISECVTLHYGCLIRSRVRATMQGVTLVICGNLAREHFEAVSTGSRRSKPSNCRPCVRSQLSCVASEKAKCITTPLRSLRCGFPPVKGLTFESTLRRSLFVKQGRDTSVHCVSYLIEMSHVVWGWFAYCSEELI